jgi:hypothetical protein
MAKQIVYGEQSRQAILRGVNQLATRLRSRSALRAAMSSTRVDRRPSPRTA